HDRLKEIDPTAAENIHPNDTKRVIRALEIFHETGRTKTELTSGQDTIREHLDPTVIGLKRPRSELKERIRRRIDRMIDDGLIEEVKSLREEWDVSKTLRQAIGFRSVSQYLDGSLTKDEIKDTMYSRTKELARKQMSWFKKFPVDDWFHPEHDHEELIAALGNKLDRHERV
ncbi:MAG: tRNA (adenosine(37)-N6)-dimethylallyltransferase MiaA, partial [bacterium]